MPPETKAGFRIRKTRDGYYAVGIPSPKGRLRWISTGEVDRSRARRLCEEGSIDRIVMLARAGTLTAKAIQIATVGRLLSCREVSDAWRTELEASVSAGTARTYSNQVARFVGSIVAAQKNFQSVTRDDLDAFVNSPEVKLNTRRLRLHALTSVYDYAHNHGISVGNLARTIKVRYNDLPYAMQAATVRVPFTHNEYSLLSQPGILPDFWRRAAILSYWTGMRLSDVVHLQIDHISDAHLKFFTHKRLHHLLVPLNHPMIGAGDLLAVLAELKAKPADPPFCFAEHIDYAERQARFSTEFGRCLAKLGISGKSFHSFRHACISRFASGGMSLREIGGLVGHDDTLVTRRYVHALETGCDRL